MSGLVNFKSANEIIAQEIADAEKKEAKTDEYSEIFESQLAGHIRSVWETNRDAKQDVYKRLLECLRARKGEYSDSEKSQISQMGGADPIYLKLTGTKCRAAASWVRDILLPVKDRPWELDPTPIPELPEDILESTSRSVMMQVQQMAEQGMNLNINDQVEFALMVKKKVLDQITYLSNEALKNVERKIEDIMVEGGYRKAMEEFVEDFVTYPFAVIKGPYYQTKTYLKWVNGKPVPKQENLLCWRRVSPFDIFYAPHANTIQDGDLIERVRFTRQKLHALLGQKGYKDSEIRRVLQKHGSTGLQDWIWENWERERLESNSTYFLSDKDTIDGLHFWGHVKGEDLLTWGYEADKVKDPQQMYPVDAILVDRCVIRVVINDNPMGHRPYHSACWDAIPGSLVGVGLPEQMTDHQKMVNSTARALATNMSVGAGPQVAILTDMIASGEDITGIYPLKIWQMKSSLTGNSGKPIEFFQPEIKAQELLAVLNQFEQKADDVTNVPRYSYGNEKIGGAGSTATGLSMLMNSAAKGIRRAIANIDLNIIQQTVYQTFIEVMMNNSDPTFRGDCKVVAKGSAAVLIKEQMHENLKEFLQITANEFDIGIMKKKGRARLLANIADNLGIDPLVLPTDEELVLEEQQAAAMAQKQAEAEIMAQQAQAQAAVAPEGGGVSPEQEMAMEQQAQALEQAEQQIELKDKMVQKQAADVQAEVKKLKQLQAKLEDQMAKIALDHISLDKKKAEMEVDTQKQVAVLEKAKIGLEMEAEELKALANKVKLISATKEEETEKEGKANEKKESAAANKEVTAAIGKALEQVAEALKSSKSPKKISIQRDEKGKIQGATMTPTKGE